MDSSTGWIATGVGRAWIVVAGANGSSGAGLSIETSEKAAGFGRLFVFAIRADGRGISRRFAGHRGVALLNDPLSRRLSGPVPGA